MAVTKMSPEEIAKNWSQRLAGSTAKIQSGVESVTVAPGQAAARQSDAYLAGVQSNVDKFKRNVSAVSLGDWQQLTVSKGIPRIATGATAAQPKFTSFMTQLLPAIQANVNSLPARGGLENNITRMTQFVRGMASFTYKK